MRFFFQALHYRISGMIYLYGIKWPNTCWNVWDLNKPLIIHEYIEATEELSMFHFRKVVEFDMEYNGNDILK